MSATDALCRSYLDAKWHFDPAAGSAAGAAEADGRLGRFDEDAMREHLAAFRALAAGAEDLDVEELGEEIDRTALLGEIRALEARLTQQRPHARDPQFWLSHLFEAVHALLVRRDDAVVARAQALLARLEAVPEFLDAAQATLHRPPAVFVDSALAMLGGGGELLAQASVTFAGAMPELGERLEAATTGALTALAGFGRALRDRIEPDPAPRAFAVGEEYFNHRLHQAHALGASAAELWRYGMHLEEAVTAEIAALADTMAPGVAWRDLVLRLRGDVPGDDLIGAYRAEVERARRFVEDRGLATLPDAALEVTATPGFLAASVPFAAYDPPASELPDRTARFFVTRPATDLPAAARDLLLREHCRHALPWTVVHEAFPGHHLQIATARGLASEVRRHLWSPVMVEGWALYAETLMDEEGYARGPEERLFRLLNLLWRAARIHLDVALHTRELTPAEAVAYLTDRLPIDVRNAEAEVRRYCAMPTYQLSYAVGRRELLRLREAYRRRAGAAFSLRRFHDDVLGFGGLPVSLIGWGLELELEP